MIAQTARRIGWPTYLGLLIAAAGVAVGILRLVWGLGRTTNLTDAAPWGIWVIVDDTVGIALAAGGFVIAAAVYSLGVHRYRVLLRPAVLTALLGYLMVIFSLVFDLGRPWNIWRVIPTWQPSSVMWAVGWSVIVLTVVLGVMLSPVFFERLGLHGAARRVMAGFLPLVLLGAIFSVLHQTALGGLFLAIPDKLHAMWYSPLLPLHFLLSAVGAAIAMVILESKLSSRLLGHKVEHDVLASLAKPAAMILGLYLALRVGDVIGRGAFDTVSEATPQFISFLIEIVFGVALPVVLFLTPAVARSPRLLVVPALLAVGGVFINRINVGIVGISNYEGYVYMPSWMEYVLTFGITAAGVVAFSFVGKFMPLFHEEVLSSADSTGA